MDFERDWNVDAAGDRQQAHEPELTALAARVKAAHADSGHLRTITPNADGVVLLPAGTDINQIEVAGRNLVVTLPDGTQMVILDGAVIVPRIVVGDVEIPSVNLAALLIGEEPQPAAGPPRSSGGNFLAADGNVGDPHGLGDLLPPTELQFTQPEQREVLPIAPDEEPEDNLPELEVPTMGPGTAVDEAGLGTENRPGESPGSNAPAPTETTSGTITYVAEDMPATVTINGVIITGPGQPPIVGTSGTLTIISVSPGAIQYSYTVTDNTSGDNVTDDFEVVVTDADGDSVTKTLVIHIIDDVPTANDDGVQQASENTAVTINAFSNDVFGADGVDIDNNPDVRVTIVSGPAAGSVIYDPATGLFTFTPAAGQEGSASFVYQIVDGDGDADTATVTITLQPDSVPTVLVAAGSDTSVDEAALNPDGSNAASTAEVASGALVITTGNDTVTRLVVGGVDVTNGGSVPGAYGTLTVSGSPAAGYSYSYELTTNTSGNATQDSFAITVTDSDGDPASTTLTIGIVDDVPTANDDGVRQASENTAVTINAFSNDVFGADGVDIDNNPDVRVTIVSGPAAGSVVYDPATGLFTFTPAAGQEGSASFVYQIVDGDGDADTATVTITLQPDSVPTVLVAAGSDTSVDEAALNPDGSNAASTAEVASGALVITTGNDTVARLVVGGVDVTNGGSVPGAYGTLTVSGSPAAGYSYSYELTTNTSGNATQDSFAITVTDSDGDPASTTLTIGIVDDVPTANDDPGYVAPEDTPITIDALTNDVFGADGVDVDNSPDIAVSIVTAPQHGTVSYDPATGLFTYVPNAVTQPTPDSFVYQIVDGDGDADTATVSILLQPDATPSILSVSSVTVDEDGLAGANGDAGRPGEVTSTGSATATGQIIVDFFKDVPSQGAALSSITLIDSSALDGQLKTLSGANVTFALNGGDLVGSAGGVEVIRIHISSATVGTGANATKVTYAYEVTLSQPVQHAIAGSEDSDLLSAIGFEVEDSDGSTAQGSFNVSVTDDIPVVSLTGNAVAAMVLDESRPVGADIGGAATLPGGRATVSANLSGSFGAVAYGADGAGSVTYALTLSAEGIGSGLFALGAGGAKGAEILLFATAGGVVGRTSAGGSDYFTITVNGAGTVTFSQQANVWHGDTSNPDDAVTLTLDGQGEFLQLRQTVTDADGDQAVASVNLGSGVFTIQDDGPSAQVSGGAAIDTLVLDESAAGTDRGASAVAPTGRASTTASFADNFVGGSVYGTDGAGSVTYALVLSGEGIGSGLFALGAGGAKGAEILLFTVNGQIVGRTSIGGSNYFTIAVDGNGTVTFSQQVNVWHADAANLDDAATLTLDGAGEFLQIRQTVTDADGDKAVASINLGSGVFTIQDDGPNAQANGAAAIDTLVLDESAAGTDRGPTVVAPNGLASITANFADNFVAGVAYGTDGAGSVGYALALSGEGIGSGLFALGVGGAKGGEILLFTVNGQIVGRTSIGGGNYFTIAVDGSGTVTFSQQANVWHGNTNNLDDAATLTLDGAGEFLQIRQTVTDADGDKAVASINLGSGVFSIQDDGPDAQVNGAAPVDTLVLDESAVGTDRGPTAVAPNGIASITANLADNFVTGAGIYGTDGAGSVGYSLAISGEGVGSGLFAFGAGGAKGAEILLFTTAGGAIVGRTSALGPDYFTISVNSTGTLTFSQQANVWHGNTANLDDAVTLTLDGVGEFLQIRQTVTDADGDKDVASVNLGSGVFTIQDDGPTLTSVADISVLNAVQSYGGNLANFSYGTDGGGSIHLAHLTNITGISYSGDGTDTVTASVNGVDYFRVHIDQVTGQYTVDVLTTRPVVNTPLSFSNIAPGNYTTVTLPGGQVFDGVSYGNATTQASQFTNDGSTINPSGNGFGIANNLVNDNEGFLFSNPNSSSLTFDVVFQPNTSQVTITYTIYKGGTPAGGAAGIETHSIVVNSDADGTVPVTLDPAADFDHMVVRFDYSGNGAARVENFSVTQQVIPNDQVLSFAVTVTDKDGDTVASTSPATTIDITFQGGAPVPPIALDLDGDGVEYLARAAGVLHDYGSGSVSTAWLAPDDGLLALRNDDGSLKIVFSTQEGETDLQGLSKVYDSNHDGVLDGRDATFAQFGVWQDADSDGVADEGEFLSLSDAGIASLNLTSDGQAGEAAGGDVLIFGQTSYTTTGGDVRVAADVAFQTGSSGTTDQPEREQQTGFNQALIAASLIAVAGAEAAVEQEPTSAAAQSEPAAQVEPAATAVSPSEPVAGEDDAFTSLVPAEEQDVHAAERPINGGSHGSEEPAPDHSTLSDGGDTHPSSALEAADTAQPDFGDHQGLLAQSIDMPAFDGNAAALVAAHEDASPAVAEVVAEAMGGTGPDIDALLAALPGEDHAPAMLNPVAAEPMGGGHLAAAAAVFDAAMAAHEAMAVAHG